MHAQLPGAGQRADHEGLAAARRAVQQHPARRIDAQPGEGVGVLQRPQHRFGQGLFGLGHVADVVERDVPDGQLLAGRAGQRPDDAERTDQIVLVELRWLAVGAGPRRRPQGRLTHQRRQVGGDETRCAAGDFVEVEVAGGHRLQQRLQQRLAGGGVGQRHAQLAVAQLGCAQPRIELVGSRGGDDQRDAVGGHRGAQLGEDQGGHRLGGGRQQGVDVGDQQHAAAVAHRASPPRPRF